MARGSKYTVYNNLNLYLDSASAIAHGTASNVIQLNADGDASTYNVFVPGEGKGNLYYNNDVSATAYLPAVAVWFVKSTGIEYAIGWINNSKNLGASTPTLNKSTIEAGTIVRITTNRLNSAFKHVLYWRINGGSGWTTIATGVENFHDWTPEITSTCNALPNATSGVFNIMVETYNGSALVGYKIINITITIPENIVPSISAPNVTETNTKIKDTLGYTSFVSGISTYSVLSTTRTAGQGATINRIQYKLGTYSYLDPPTLTTAKTFGTMTGTSIVVYAIIVDSRGRKATVSKTISQATYSPPTVSLFTAIRYNPENRTQIQIALKATQTKLSNTNTLRYKLEYKKNNETTWSQLKAYNAYQTDDLNITTVQTIANDNKYNIRATVQDLLGVETSSIITLVNTEKKWLEIINGEDINFIGNLMNNGGLVLTQNHVRELRVPFTNGTAILTPAQVGVTVPSNYLWFITPNYSPGTGIMFGVPQAQPNSINIYLRTQAGAAPSNGEYSFNIIGVPKA